MQHVYIAMLEMYHAGGWEAQGVSKCLESTEGRSAECAALQSSSGADLAQKGMHLIPASNVHFRNSLLRKCSAKMKSSLGTCKIAKLRVNKEKVSCVSLGQGKIARESCYILITRPCESILRAHAKSWLCTLHLPQARSTNGGCSSHISFKPLCF